MINGEALPTLDVPPPSSSFDEQGRFKSAVELPGKFCTVKLLNFRMPENFAENYLKFKERGQTLGYFIKKMQME